MLSDIDIRAYVEKCDLVIPFKDKLLQPNSYDVTLGDEFKWLAYNPTSGVDETNAYIDLSRKLPVGLKYESKKSSAFILYPGMVVLATTVETVHIPDTIAATVEGKSSLGRLGLTVHVTAGFIDSGFNGQITLELKNENPWPIVLRSGMKIAQLAFHELSTPVDRSYGSSQLDSHYQDQHGTQQARY